MKKVVLILAIGFIILGFILPVGIRGAIANNLWSSAVIKGYLNGTLSSELLLAAPTGHPHASLLQARVAMEKGETEKAIGLLEPFTATSDPVLMGTQAEVLFTAQRYPEALEIWRKLGEYGDIEHAARILSAEGNIDMEILAWRKANEIRPDIYRIILLLALVSKANAFRDEGNYSEAISQYGAIIEEFPQDERPYYELAWAYWLIGEADLAISSIERAVVIGPSNLRVYLRAGQIYELAGNPQKALQAYQRALQISPENLEALQALERIKHTH